MRLFLLARAVSWGGSAVTLVALPVLIYQRTGSAALTGLLSALEAVPYLLLGLPAGALADRWDRRRTLAVTSWAGALLVGSVPLAAILDLLTTGQLLLVAAGTASAFVFFDAAAFGALPALAGRDGVARATRDLMTVSTLIGLAGPPAAGLLIATIGAPEALLLDALSFAAAALLLARLTLPAIPRTAHRDLPGEIRAGFRFITGHPTVGPLTWLGIGNSLTEGAVLGLIVVVAVQRVGLDPHDTRLGLFYGAAAVGTLLASTALPALRRRLPPSLITLPALAANGVFLALWAITPNLVLSLAILLIWQAANTLASLNGIIERQELTPDDLQGRVNTTARMIAWGGFPAGAALAGLLAQLTGPTTALLTAAVAVLLTLATPAARDLAGTGRSR
ncbi:MFS transporter [Acrocarpospora catenulata]|uniref:MFS transporter n=1 Tax=Acrocarpospora catenulata TaxID=2836182 RepID=UPI001BDA6519|nr:MFS transporter [Acrocarpospora catenulata]